MKNLSNKISNKIKFSLRAEYFRKSVFPDFLQSLEFSLENLNNLNDWLEHHKGVVEENFSQYMLEHCREVLEDEEILGMYDEVLNEMLWEIEYYKTLEGEAKQRSVEAEEIRESR